MRACTEHAGPQWPGDETAASAGHGRHGLVPGLFLLCFLLSACAENFPKLNPGVAARLGIDAEAFSNHYIVTQIDGYPLGAERDHDRIPTPEFLRQTTRAIEDTLKQATVSRCAAQSAGCVRLLVFIHGGLNSYRSDFDRMVKLMQKDGLLEKRTSAYVPVFVNWDSSLNTLTDDLFFIRLGDRKRDLGLMSFPFLLPARMIMSAANVPVRLADTVISYAEYCNFATGVKPCYTSLDTWISWGMFPLYTITAPILDGFGSPAWYQMKRRAKLAAASRLTTITDDFWANDQLKSQFYGAEGAALTLVRALGAAIQRERRPVEVTLIGHSMGAFIVNRMLSAIENIECSVADSVGTGVGTSQRMVGCRSPSDTFHIRRAIYLAPASPLDEFDNITVPFLANHPNTDAWVFALNRKDEAGEYSTPVQKLVPRGSLLTWIDGIFEPASSIGEKTLGRMANLEKYYGTVPERHQLACPSPSAWEKAVKTADVSRSRDAACREQYRLDQERIINGRATYGFRPVCLNVNRSSAAVGSRVHVFQSEGYCHDRAEGPLHHGDFSQPRYLGEVLCITDPTAFKSTGFCSPDPALNARSVWSLEPRLSDVR
jgi:pimeloyl-ACP methyl ester carboxylesterase